MSTVGAFLTEKGANMSFWLKQNGCPVDLDIAKMHQLQVTALAQILHERHAQSIADKDFAGLLVDKENVPPQLLMTVAWVANRPELHDKFWRYLTLFSDTVSK